MSLDLGSLIMHDFTTPIAVLFDPAISKLTAWVSVQGDGNALTRCSASAALLYTKL